MKGTVIDLSNELGTIQVEKDLDLLAYRFTSRDCFGTTFVDLKTGQSVLFDPGDTPGLATNVRPA